MDIVKKIAAELKIKISQAENAVALIDDGNTVPFIARYRKEMTGGLSDVDLRDLYDRLIYLRNLEERKEEVIRLIDEQGKLTEELREEILKAEVLQRVEDLYKPYKQKKSTRASKAKEKGLEPLASIIWEMEIETGTPNDVATPFINKEKGVNTPEDAIAGALDIIAEIISDDPDFNAEIREKTYRLGSLQSEATEEEKNSVYEMYFDYSEPISKIANHRVLAINRGEKEKKLKIKMRAPADDILKGISDVVIINEKCIFLQHIIDTILDSYKRLIAPSIEREIRNSLTDRAEKEAVKVFGKNTEKLLMTAPVKNKRVLSIDPGYRTGCKVTMLDENGKLLAYTTVYPTPPKSDTEKAKKTLKEVIEKYKADIIVIGNGTASRETEFFVAEMVKEIDRKIHYTIVNEAGASIYSASKLATEEYPKLDVTTRGAMSIGKRLQDPLAELVKIEPKHIGVGQYQHDLNQGFLDIALTNVVEDCVNRVGVDLNTASSSLLKYIAGVNAAIAKNIVAFREENGSFTSRKELLKVSKLGEKAFNQCAGFMRIVGGKEPLDSTSVHPESYEVAEAMLKKLGIDKKGIEEGEGRAINEKIMSMYPVPGKDTENRNSIEKSIEVMAQELGVGALTLTDIVNEIKKPGRDPRDEMPEIIFRDDVLTFEDLKIDMELSGTVRNVVDFGAFVDIGVKNDGLVHISEITDKYLKHPLDILSVGDTIKVKIIGIDEGKQKISLTMKGL